MTSPLLVPLGRLGVDEAFEAMQAFHAARAADNESRPGEIWWCEHPPTFTQGLAGRAEHLLDPGDIPVVQTNRGGQVTYHGPGQVVMYPLVDLKQLGIYVKEYVYRLEHCVLKTLESFGVTGHRIPGAPGIYVRLNDPHSHAPLESVAPRDRLGVAGADPFRGLGKIAALGIKVSRNLTLHGLALNVAMDLKPFERINPCGYAGLTTVDLATLGVNADTGTVAERLGARLVDYLTP